MIERIPATRRSDRKRAAIVDAAVREFDAHGFEATSMDAVAARAGVSKRTVYNHFASKETLFREIRNELVQRAREVEPVVYAPAEPLSDQLREIGRREMEWLVSEDFLCLARVTIPAFLNCQEFASETFTDFQASQERIVRWIRAADRDGRLAVADPRRAAKQFMVLLNGFALWPTVIGGQPAPGERERRKIVESAVAMFLDHYAT